MTADDGFWADFPQDPRVRQHAGLRASDADRERVLALLADAFAEGRLEPGELDARTTSATAARTLGQLPPLVADLVPSSPPRRLGLPLSRDGVGDAVRALVPDRMLGPGELVRATPESLDAMAVEAWRDRRRSAAVVFVAASGIAWALWAITGQPGFLWPLIIVAVFGLNLGATVAGRDRIVSSERARLASRQRKQRRRRGLP